MATSNGISSPFSSEVTGEVIGEIDYFDLFLEEEAYKNTSTFNSTGSTPSTLDSPDAFTPYSTSIDAGIPPIPTPTSSFSYSNSNSNSNSFQTTSSGKFLSNGGGAISPSSTLHRPVGNKDNNDNINGGEQFQVPSQNTSLIDWRNGNGIGTSGEGPFTVDAGGTSSPAIPLNRSHTNLSNQEWMPSPVAQSYSGTSSPYLYQPASYSVFGQVQQEQQQQQQQSTSKSSSGASSPHLYSQYQSPIDPASLALHMNLEAQAQQITGNSTSSSSTSMNPPAIPTSNGRGGSTTGRGRGRGRGRGKAVADRGTIHPIPATTTPASTSTTTTQIPLNPGGVQPFYHNNFDFSGLPITTHQRPLPPMPIRAGSIPTASTSVLQPPLLSTSVQASLQHQQLLLHQQLLQQQQQQQQQQPQYVTNPYASHQLTFTPTLSRPVSPRVAGVDYDFSALEKDLDHFSTVGGGFASAAAAAMASVGSKKTAMGSVQAASRGYSTNYRGGEVNVAGGVGGSGTNLTTNLFHHTPTSMQPLADILPEPFYASLPARTPPARLTPGDSQSPKEVDLFASLDSNHILGLSPAGSSSNDSPTSSTIIDEESAEALAKKDPIAAQVWRMFNKAKHTLPNGARMENLTWRLMSMTLKKRREETAAAELLAETEAASLKFKKEEEAENLDNLGVGRQGFGEKFLVAGLPRMKAVIEESERDGDRGRKGRSSKSSSSESPEGQDFEEDFMDWRAKSQSRSRSRAPGESVMDWRAQSRSRSRAPAFRTPMPPPEVFPAVAHRFRSDSTGTSNDNAVSALAASLGLSADSDLFGNSASGFDGSQLASTSTSSTEATLNCSRAQSISTEQNGSDPNLAAIADTLNQLISLQSIATSPPQQIINPTSLNGNATWPSVLSLPKPMTFAASSVGPRVVEGSYGSQQNGEYAYSANGTQTLLSAQQQLHQFLNQGPSLGASTSNTSTIVPAAVASSPYATAAALAQSTRPFSFNPSTASGLSLARPQNVLPEATHVATPGHTQPPTPSHTYPQSAPVYNHLINPFNQFYYETEANQQNPLYDYFSPPSAASSYSSSFQMDGGLTHVNPSHLLNASTVNSPQVYDPESNWEPSPISGTEPSTAGSPSPPNKSNGISTSAGNVEIHFLSQLNSRPGSIVPLRTVSSSDLELYGKGMMSMSLPSQINNLPHLQRQQQASRPNLSMTPSGKVSKFSVGGGKQESPIVEGETKCLNCSTTNTPLWRRDGEGRPLCNACGLFRNLHGVDRPANLNTGVIKKRNRAKGVKEVVPKKVSAAGRNSGGRRNSTGHSPPPSNPARVISRAGDPYPSTAVRADRAGQLLDL